jgi:hypothetical protein
MRGTAFDFDRDVSAIYIYRWGHSLILSTTKSLFGNVRGPDGRLDRSKASGRRSSRCATTRRTGRGSSGRAAVSRDFSPPGRRFCFARRCATRSARCTGPAPRPRRFGRRSSTGRSDRGSAPRPRWARRERNAHKVCTDAAFCTAALTALALARGNFFGRPRPHLESRCCCM